MRVIDGFRGLAPEDRGAVIALGNFDGVHLGHQALIDAARSQAEGQGAPVGVVTFEPHPRQFFQPDIAGFRLTTWDAKTRILAGLGVSRLYRIGFDAALSAMSPEAFARAVLVDGLGIGHVIVGADFRFGAKRAGDAETLSSLGAELGFGVTVSTLIGDETGDYASTSVRALLGSGDCEAAGQALGRWHAVTGPVIKGDQRGRDLGYPTANLAFADQMVPRYGVYAARVTVHEGPHAGTHDGVASIGERPTFGVNAANFEVHLFDFAGDLYGVDISAALIRWLRGEVAFTTVEALIAQMDRDSAEARAVLATAPDRP